jgi:type I restriction enzyme R subunit
MIEFKQIIGRGTRIFDGKDFFTIYDFVNAHHHFNDPEWDGEPIEPEPQTGTGVIRTTRRKENAYDPKGVGRTPPTRIRVRLADGKERAIQHMESTTFWHPDGKPMSAQQFMESLFGFLPQFFANEQELRDLWSKPDTRAHLLSNSQKKASAKTNYTKCN